MKEITLDRDNSIKCIFNGINTCKKNLYSFERIDFIMGAKYD